MKQLAGLVRNAHRCYNCALNTKGTAITLIIIPGDLSDKVKQAITEMQASGKLPSFEIPEIKVARADRPQLGDYSTPVAMQLARVARMKPDEIARLLATSLPKADYLASVEAAGGYLNFRVSGEWLQRQVDEILQAGESYGYSAIYAGKKAQVECVSANPTGPITVGRIRGGVIGDTLARLLRAVGYQTELEYYYNDAGAQIDRLAESVQARYLERLGRPYTFPADGYQGDYIYGIADELIAKHGDRLVSSSELVEFRKFAVARIQEMQRSSLKRIGIVFDNYFSEQSVYHNGSIQRVIAQLRERNVIYEALRPEKDEDAEERPDQEEREAAATGPATWIRMRQLRGTKKDAVLIKSSGEPTYRLPDIAYHINKLERGFDLAVNVLGADHIEEAKDVKAVVSALGYPGERIHALIHQFVTITEAGETKRMSTRKGEFVTLDELVDDVGADAVRYFILARSADSHIDFDLELARKQSNENPVYYIQNAHVRCASIARVAAERGIAWDDGDVSLLSDPRELALIRKLIELPEVIEKAVEELAPHRLAFWAHEELARLFHPTYEEIRALHESVPLDRAKARLKLYAAARIVLQQTLKLMGMSAPDEM